MLSFKMDRRSGLFALALLIIVSASNKVTAQPSVDLPPPLQMAEETVPWWNESQSEKQRLSMEKIKFKFGLALVEKIFGGSRSGPSEMSMICGCSPYDQTCLPRSEQCDQDDIEFVKETQGVATDSQVRQFIDSFHPRCSNL